MIWARGAMPETLPYDLPNISACTPALPAAVEAVCVPWPASSRAESNSSGSSPTNSAVGLQHLAGADQLVVALARDVDVGVAAWCCRTRSRGRRSCRRRRGRRAAVARPGSPSSGSSGARARCRCRSRRPRRPRRQPGSSRPHRGRRAEVAAAGVGRDVAHLVGEHVGHLGVARELDRLGVRERGREPVEGVGVVLDLGSSVEMPTSLRALSWLALSSFLLRLPSAPPRLSWPTVATSGLPFMTTM